MSITHIVAMVMAGEIIFMGLIIFMTETFKSVTSAIRKIVIRKH